MKYGGEVNIKWNLITHIGKNNRAVSITLSWNDADNFVKLENIHVSRDYRRRGLGSYLLAKVKPFVDELGKTEIIGHIGYLDIEGHPDENDRPKPYLPDFYKANGFVVQENERDQNNWWGNISCHIAT